MGKLRGTLCYLAGAMDCDPTGGVEWRNQITPFLKSKGIGVLNPCNKPTLEAKEDAIMREEVNRLKKLKNFDKVKEIIEPVVAYDLRMIDISHFLILNVEPDIHMCGSYHEMAVGLGQHKPILVICKNGIERIPNWIFGIISIESMFNSVNECCDYLDKIDSGKILPTFHKWKFFDFSKVFE